MTMSALVIVGGFVLAGLLVRAAMRATVRDRSRQLEPPRTLLPGRSSEYVAAALARADLDLSPEAALKWWGLGVGAAAWFALVLAPPLLVPAIAAVLIAGPVSLRLRSHHADRAARVALPGVLDHVVAQLRAGGSVIEALQVAAARPGPLRPDFARMDARLTLGASLDQTLEQWAVERPIAGVRGAAGALAMVTTMGGSAATALEGLVQSLRNDDAAMGEAKALSSQARISAVVVGAAPLVYLVFATATDPASSRVLVSTTAGQICLAVGLGMEVLAGFWMRALVGGPT